VLQEACGGGVGSGTRKQNHAMSGRLEGGEAMTMVEGKSWPAGAAAAAAAVVDPVKSVRSRRGTRERERERERERAHAPAPAKAMALCDFERDRRRHGRRDHLGAAR
jgi:hypothetical protein